MSDVLRLKIELEAMRRMYWQSQQQLTQVLIERSLAVEKGLQAQLELESAGEETVTESKSEDAANT